METFLNSPILQTLAAVWLGAGITKGFLAARAIPTILSWYVFYKNDGDDSTPEWYTDKGLVVCCGIMMVFSVILWGIVGPLLVFRETPRKFFTPYGDPFLAGIAATYLKIPTGVEPDEFETWDHYQMRIGDSPKQVADAILIVQPKVPQHISKLVEDAKETAGRLQELQNREDIEVAEDEEFRDK